MKKILKSFILIFFVCLVVVAGMTGSVAMAINRGDFTGNAQYCEDTSDHANIFSVKYYACVKSSIKTQNACATWLSPAGNSHTNVVLANITSLTVPMAFYGMCTYAEDTTTNLVLLGDNGSIPVPNSRFTRSGDWGRPTSMATTLNIPKFIEGLYPYVEGDYLVYSRVVYVNRWHSGGDIGNTGSDYTLIVLKLAGGDIVDAPETPDTLCTAWGFPGITSTATDGTTTVRIKVKNADPRFTSDPMGAWNDTQVYAMPGDKIAWHSCYYPGVQATASTQVSEVVVNGTTVKPLPGLSDTNCQGDVALTKVALSSSGITWENQFTLNKPLDNLTGDNGTISGGAIGSTTIKWGHNEGTVDAVKDVGTKRTEDIISGKPVKAVITEYTVDPKKIYNNGTCCMDANNDGVNEIKVGGTSYPVCPAGTSVDSDGKGSINLLDPATGSAIIDPATGTAATATCYRNDNENCTTCEDVSGDYKCLKCTNKYTENPIKATVSNGPAKDSASVLVPYNYNNSVYAEINTNPVYSGEAMDVVAVASVMPKHNDRTHADYATKAPGTTIKVIGYVTNNPNSISGNKELSQGRNYDFCNLVNSEADAKQCVSLKNTTENLNANGNLGGDGKQINVNAKAFDASAGDFACVIAAIYPANSGSDENWSDAEGSRTWRYSEPSCAVIAKKPTFQVWGGGLYSVKNVEAFVGEKREIYKNYMINGRVDESRFAAGNTKTYFGSWVDQNLVIKSGKTTTVASGAATGANTSSIAGSGNTGTLCNARAPLSFANTPCTTNQDVGGFGAGAGKDTIDRDKLIDYWIGGNAWHNNTSGGASLDLSQPDSVGGEVTTASGVKVRYVKTNGGLSIYGNINRSRTATFLIKAEGNVTINGNIKYTGSYTTLEDIPKVIIYAKNIDIQCGVTEVDAILITRRDGTVRTCSDPGDRGAPDWYSDVNRSNQLKIFGMVMTDKIEMGRTYGAAAWNPDKFTEPTDGKAAEVFDYDSSILMWSEYMSSAAETSTLQVTYQRELAPRY